MKYDSVALAVTTASIGFILLLISYGFTHVFTLLSIPLLALGFWTLAYGIHRRCSYHGIWGGILVGLGLALALERATGNLLLNFAILTIALSIAGLLLALKG